MQINHLCNSLIYVKENNSSIICDPWIGTTHENAWASYPTYKNGKKILENLKANFIYISHLHCDHFAPMVLKKYDNKKIKILIKKFPDQRLKNKIKALGFKNIIELEAWEKRKINNDFTITIVPQLSTTTSGAHSEVNYDLDTSIIIKGNKSEQIFFNNVDNPLSDKDLAKVKRFVKKEYESDIDVACLPVGAASEYPQCFMNINRNKEKANVIKRSLTKLNKSLNVIKPKVFFQAGGTYLISGKFNVLNKYIAQPNQQQIDRYTKNLNCKITNIEGDGEIFFSNNEWNIRPSNLKASELKKPKVIEHFSKQQYLYQSKKSKLSSNQVQKLFSKASINYNNIIKKLNIRTKWKIEIKVYENIKLNKVGKINKDASKFKDSYIVTSNILESDVKQKNVELVCHIDKDLFAGLMQRKFNWNTALSGTWVLFDRKPNVFNPSIPFSLNFLAV